MARCVEGVLQNPAGLTTHLCDRQTEAALYVSRDGMHEASLLLCLQNLGNSLVRHHHLLLLPRDPQEVPREFSNHHLHSQTT